MSFEQGIRQSVNSETRLYGVLGDPIRHSRSPVMIGRAFSETGVNAIYTAFHVSSAQLAAAVQGIRGLGIQGMNVTLPHKVAVMEHLDEIDETARIAGAVNTIVNRAGVLKGYNTDGIGYVRSLKEEVGIPLQGATFLLLGAGGAARGVAHALAKESPAKMVIANRTMVKAKQLAAELMDVDAQGISWDELGIWSERAHFIINTTPIGMHPNIYELPMDPRLIRPGTVVSDLIYNPLYTEWLLQAKVAGAKIHSGLGMFIYQGAFAFEYWTGIAAPIRAMREVVLATFEQKDDVHDQ